jgi:hypothetical protein
LEIDPPLAAAAVSHLLTVACCFKVQVESDFDKGRRGSHGSCVLGVHMLGVEIVHLLCVKRVKAGDAGDAERELLGRARVRLSWN